MSKKKGAEKPTPNNNFTVTTADLKHLSAATAQEALKAALLSLGVSKATNHLTDDEAVRNLYLLAKPTEDGSKRIHRFTLPWNLRFDVKSMTLVRITVEDGDKPKEVRTGRVSKETAKALAPSVVKHLGSEVDKLVELMAGQLKMNEGFNTRLTALEAKVEQLVAVATKPAPKATKVAKVDVSDLAIEPKQAPKAKAGKKAPKATKVAKSKSDISDLSF